jgi:hypothetical protein
MIYCIGSFLYLIYYSIITIIEIKFLIKYNQPFWCHQIFITLILLLNFLISLYMVKINYEKYTIEPSEPVYIIHI